MGEADLDKIERSLPNPLQTGVDRERHVPSCYKMLTRNDEIPYHPLGPVPHKRDATVLLKKAAKLDRPFSS